jgi:predicted proteasome-type protease
VRIEQDHPEFRQISDSWAASLRQAFNSLPTVKV